MLEEAQAILDGRVARGFAPGGWRRWWCALWHGHRPTDRLDYGPFFVRDIRTCPCQRVAERGVTYHNQRHPWDRARRRRG